MPVRHLEKLFSPKNVAIVGELKSESCKGKTILKNLRQSKFKGEIYPVTNGEDINKLNKELDISIFTCSIKQVFEVLEKTEKNLLTNVFIASAIADKNDYIIIEKIKNLAKKKHFRLLGYNSIGLIIPHLNFNLSFYPDMPQNGEIALISQSGTIVSSMLDYAKQNNIGFKYIISLGVIIDIDFGDLIDFLWGENDVKSIILYIEKVRNVKKFLSSSRYTSRIKPIIAFKSGNNDKSYDMILIRENEPVGEYRVYENAFRRAGIINVKSITALVQSGRILTERNIPEGDRLVVITNSGASAISVVDELHNYKLGVLALEDNFLSELKKNIKKGEYFSNPIDISGSSNEEDFIKCGKICLKAHIDTLMVIIVLNGLISPEYIIEEIKKNNIYNKNLIFICLGGGEYYNVKFKKFKNIFFTIKDAVDAYYYKVNYRYKLKKLIATPVRYNKKYNFDYVKAKEIIDGNLNKNRNILNLIDSKKLLDSYSLPLVKYEILKNLKDIFLKVENISYPINFKIVKNNFGITKNKIIDNPKYLKKYIEEIKETETEYSEIIIEEALDNFEIVLRAGIKYDVQFGPYIFLGLGGEYKDINDELAIMLPPLNSFLTNRLIEKSYLYTFLNKLKLVEKLQDILIKLSYLSSDFSTIKELTLEPLVSYKGEFYILSSRIHIQKTSIEPPSHFMIAPYPNNYEFKEKLKDNKAVLIRPIMPEDENMHREFFYSLSKETNYYRFFSYRKKLTKEQLASFTQIDYDREIAIVAVIEEKGQSQIIGVNRLVYYPNEEKYEFAIVVTDKWQRSGVGHILMEKLIYIAKDRSIEKIYGSVLSENYKMLHFIKKFGFEIINFESEIVYICLDLRKNG